jgi:hypothetical protein
MDIILTVPDKSHWCVYTGKDKLMLHSNMAKMGDMIDVLREIVNHYDKMEEIKTWIITTNAWK